MTSIVGFSLLNQVYATYNSFYFVTLKEWAERKAPDEQYEAIKKHLNRELAKINEGIAFSFPPPAIPGVGTSGGFNFLLEDRDGKDPEFLDKNLATIPGSREKAPRTGGRLHDGADRHSSGICRRGPSQGDLPGRATL